MRIAVDAMGGDFAPHNVVAGVLEALQETNNQFRVLLVGSEPTIQAELSRLQNHSAACEVINASQVIEMHDGATTVLKQKKDSSIAVGITLHKEGRADAFVSAGNTGAVMTASTLILGRIEGVGRPTIGTFFPSEQGVCLLLDAGASVDCKAQHLYEFAVMGNIYAQEMFMYKHPTVGLLNIGEEPSKGSEAAKGAHQILKKSSLNFIGNVEGGDILRGKAQVVVCDGFVGNSILKFAESVPSFFKGMLARQFGKSVFSRIVGLLVRGTLRAAFKSMDYEEYGGVPLLGVNGVSIIGHGKSTPKAIKNMILKAEEMVRKNINQRIKEALTIAQ